VKNIQVVLVQGNQARSEAIEKEIFVQEGKRLGEKIHSDGEMKGEGIT